MKATIPTHLTDAQLVEELHRCARAERGATAVLVAHLAEMDARELHLGLGFSSLFTYCREVLHLSESATYKRIGVARAARRYPIILDHLSEGSLSVSTARLLVTHLTDENHEGLLADAAGLRKREVAELVAQRFPRPDVPPLVRKLPEPRAAGGQASDGQPPAAGAQPVDAEPPSDTPPPFDASSGSDGAQPTQPTPPAPPSRPATPPRPLATPLSVGRYQIRFTASAATWQKLRVARDLLRHAVPDGDPAEIVDRALTLLIADLTRKKHAAVKRPARQERPIAPGSRHIPANVRREVWARDQARCAFVAPSGRRCDSTAFLEYHHVRPHAAGGEATTANIQLRCQAHNAYEATLFYGPSKVSRRKDSSGSAVRSVRELAPGPVQRTSSIKRRARRAH